MKLLNVNVLQGEVLRFRVFLNQKPQKPVFFLAHNQSKCRPLHLKICKTVLYVSAVNIPMKESTDPGKLFSKCNKPHYNQCQWLENFLRLLSLCLHLSWQDINETWWGVVSYLLCQHTGLALLALVTGIKRDGYDEGQPELPYLTIGNNNKIHVATILFHYKTSACNFIPSSPPKEFIKITWENTFDCVHNKG